MPSPDKSRQFTTGKFFGCGWVPSLALMGVLARFEYFVRSMMGIPVLAPKV